MWKVEPLFKGRCSNISDRARNQLKVKTDVAAKQREFVQQLKQKDESHAEEVKRLQEELSALRKQLLLKDNQVTACQQQVFGILKLIIEDSVDQHHEGFDGEV